MTGATEPPAPTFTVVVATYERGAAIAPTLRSVAGQALADLEVLVVSDGPAAPGLAEAVAAQDERFTLLELPERTRSQSGPNNLGWSRARGRYVAYLGHDDIWLPDHLASLAAALEPGEAQVAVAGCLFVGARGGEAQTTSVSGLFDPGDPDAGSRYFFPPSSVAHVRDLPAAAGGWPEPTTSRLPVDDAFQQRQVGAGCRFTSTGRISVLKFASAARYLSYLAPAEAEQLLAEALLGQPEALADFIARGARAAREGGLFMQPRYDASELAPGELLARNERVRGIDVPPVGPVRDSAWLEVTDELRGFDWHPLETDGVRRWRWSGPSDRPRLALPFVHADDAADDAADEAPDHAAGELQVRLHVREVAASDTLAGLRAWVNGVEVPAQVHEQSEQNEHDAGPTSAIVTLSARLRPERPSVLELAVPVTDHPLGRTTETGQTHRRIGLAVCGVEVETAEAAATHPDEPLLGRAALRHELDCATRERDRARAEFDAARADAESAMTDLHAANTEIARAWRAADDTRADAERAWTQVAGLQEALGTARAKLAQARQRARDRAEGRANSQAADGGPGQTRV